MLTPLHNEPRDYAWGSTTLIPQLQRRTASGSPEAEIWFGDHPGSPATLPGGTTLREQLGEERLPYLLKLLAAASPLSIQVHPSKTEAVAGYASEQRAGIPVDAPARNYRDDNHKPEVIVALSDRFEALAGLRELDTTRRLLAVLGDAGDTVASRLRGGDDAASLRDTLAWLLSGDAQPAVDAIAAALTDAASGEFAAELATARRVAAAYPGDPGIVVALLMNLVVLRRGEALFVPAGVLHAYLAGLGVEIMAASDNVLRGGLTPKHVDVPELLRVLDTRAGDPPRLAPQPAGDGVEVFRPGIPDFELWHLRADAAPRALELHGTAIVLAVAGRVRAVAGSGEAVDLAPGRAAVAIGETTLTVTGEGGELFVALPGRP